ncbi:MAG: peptidoglycan DD-metalloendopeptidase family protein [Candidatus Azotimanducaceae bacterium WSBS_2022_MAG_OTU7]
MSKRIWNNKAGRAGLGLLLLVLLITGCVGLSPIYNSAGGSDTYIVSKGDTLYSIAFRYGLDYKSIAMVNSIRPPYTIFVDQVILLRGSARLPEKDSGPVATQSASQKTPKKTSQKTPKKTISKTPRAPSAPVAGWQWPLKGEIIARFSLVQPVNKGIDIAGDKGDVVTAAAAGVVVYAGGNLRGYGQLVIVKHNDNFLSAYGNNQKMLVKEGEEVKAGKSIARVGKTGANVEMLHFEIRRDGKPVDPVKYLPAR